MNFDTLGVHLGTFRVAQKCQKGLKVPLFSQKCLGRIFGLLFEKIGLLFDQTVWSHCTDFFVQSFYVGATSTLELFYVHTLSTLGTFHVKSFYV